MSRRPLGVDVEGGGRLVKLIGAGALFVVDEPEQACRLVLALLDTFEFERFGAPKSGR